jgi:hypothetical protein
MHLIATQFALRASFADFGGHRNCFVWLQQEKCGIEKMRRLISAEAEIVS